MCKVTRDWQDSDYVLGYFAKNQRKSRKEYESFVKEEFSKGRNNESTGGGLIRSLGGWVEAREILRKKVKEGRV